MLLKRDNWHSLFVRLNWFLSLALCGVFLSGCRQKEQAPPPGGQKVLTIAHENTYVSLDPHLQNDSVTRSILGNVYESLVQFDSNMKIVSGLAERWENPNDLTWRFYLRKNIKFQNGKPLTAADVVYSIRRGLTHERSRIKQYLISVKEARAIDDTTVDILTDRPNPLLLNRLTFVYILPSDSHPQQEISHPIGTGSYEFVDQTADRKIRLNANPNYWKGKPSIDHVQFTSYDTDEKTVDALLKGNVQLIRDFSETLIPSVQASSNCQVITRDSLAVTFLGFNLNGKPKENILLNPDIRKAIFFAIDTNELVKKTAAGRANAVTQLVSPNVFGFDPRYVGPPRNQEKARQLLAKAGYATGFSSDIYGSDINRLQTIADQLKLVGINLGVHLVPWEELDGRLRRHELPLYTLGWSCSTGDASDFLDSCAHSQDPKSGYGNFNFAVYKQPDVDRYIELSGQTLKVTERKEYLQKAMSIVMSDLPYVPLFSRYRQYGVSKDIAWEPRQDGCIYAADVNWKQSP